MQSFVPTRFIKTAVVGAACLLTACDTEGIQLPSSPEATALRFFRSTQLTVLNTQLRPLPATNASAWGHLQLKINAIPVDPCGPEVSNPASPGFAALAICGDVKNPQNDDIVNGAGLYFLPSFPSDVDAILVAGMTVGIPVDPCRNYSFRGGTQISLALADAIIASPGAIRSGSAR